MANSYIPPRDADFGAWLTNFAGVGAASPSAYGLSAGQVTAVSAQSATYSAALALATDPSTRTPATVAAKDTARANAEAVVRPIATTISRSQAVTNADKAAIGVTIPSVTPSPIPAPTTAPALVLIGATIGMLDLAYRDSTTPTSRAKPAGVIGLELWSSVGTVAATDPAQCAYVGTATRTPVQLPTGQVGGKTVTVYSRWTTQSGPGGIASVGPWSAPLVTHTL